MLKTLIFWCCPLMRTKKESVFTVTFSWEELTWPWTPVEKLDIYLPTKSIAPYQLPPQELSKSSHPKRDKFTWPQSSFQMDSTSDKPAIWPSFNFFRSQMSITILETTNYLSTMDMSQPKTSFDQCKMDPFLKSITDLSSSSFSKTWVTWTSLPWPKLFTDTELISTVELEVKMSMELQSMMEFSSQWTMLLSKSPCLSSLTNCNISSTIPPSLPNKRLRKVLDNSGT